MRKESGSKGVQPFLVVVRLLKSSVFRLTRSLDPHRPLISSEKLQDKTHVGQVVSKELR